MSTTWPLVHGLSPSHWRWPADQSVLLLLDGVRVSGLARKLYEWSDGAMDAELLYAGTPWATVQEVSPWLIALPHLHDPIIAMFLEEGAGDEGGYLIVSDASLVEVADHLRQLIQVRHPMDIPMLLRLADPAVIHALLPEEPSMGLAPWGPITQIVVPDAVVGVWRAWSPDTEVAQVCSPIEPPGYRLNEAQLQRLQACDRRADIRQLASFVETHCAGWLSDLTPQARHAHLSALVTQGRSWGFTSLREWSLLCTVLARLDIPSLDDARLSERTRHLLAAVGTGTGLERLEAALTNMNDITNNTSRSLS
ncbi:protein of unknown function [Modicisalibacter ilicicola DSM 19980]|uniref:DUF4123 domain-containing protein n=1 Tax=Modicisalibacter ilicicola DSM 19980 TaxID=1121942 RepID=A0A1M5B3I2_9GAMM|nr:DUF4123 domain-containing protein [Halomonas ilicicola]SHF37121.1 protein of unknown function [Halomonas ilicicola DSM 19980]